MLQFFLEIRKSYHLVSSSVITTSIEDLEKILRVRTRVKEKLFSNYALRDMYSHLINVLKFSYIFLVDFHINPHHLKPQSPLVIGIQASYSSS
jgi:hypothetical protein